ncbi:hypothetical protein [Desulfosediminicola flagellatus]|uniref:hypothetical protein n=1 Tax=Desulfosediminicola flagellatus TaxID=2569541 RepID=UPI0010AD8C63|nr:hypothetical protein [Desulfosediminicola flagellatus]
MKKLFREGTPNTLFILGVATLPAFLFQEKLLYRCLATIFFLLLALYSGKKIRPLPALLLLASITAAALLVPYGKVLVTILGWPITVGALKMGFSRGVLLLGLLYLSKVSVVHGLALPGAIGQGISKVFFYLDRFSENCSMISVRDLPGTLDKLLHAVSESDADSDYTSKQKENRNLPLILLLLVSLVCWLFLFL